MIKERTSILAFIILLFGVANSTVYADVPMYLVIVYAKYAYWWAIPLAVAVEAFAIKWIFSLSHIRAAIYSIVVNFASAIVGIAFYPNITGIVASTELVTQFTSIHLFELIILFAVVDTGIELLVLRYAFKLYVLGKSGRYFFLANIVTTAIIFLAILKQ